MAIKSQLANLSQSTLWHVPIVDTSPTYVTMLSTLGERSRSNAYTFAIAREPFTYWSAEPWMS